MSKEYNDKEKYGYDLLENLILSDHYLFTIEDILKKPQRKKIKRINETQFSIHLTNGDFILATKKGKTPRHWIFNYKDTEKDTRLLNPDLKYESRLRKDLFIKNKHLFKWVLGCYNPNYFNEFHKDDYIKSQKEVTKELEGIWKKLSKAEKSKYLGNYKIETLKLSK